MNKEKELLTNEFLQNVEGSNFERVKYAIDLARFYIHSGQETSIEDIIYIIKKHPRRSYLAELEELEKIEE